MSTPARIFTLLSILCFLFSAASVNSISALAATREQEGYIVNKMDTDTESDTSEVTEEEDIDDSQESTLSPEDISDSSSLFSDNRNRDNEKAIQSVDSGIRVTESTIAKKYNAFDVLHICAFVFVIICVVVFWIKHTIKLRKEESWMKLK